MGSYEEAFLIAKIDCYTKIIHPQQHSKHNKAYKLNCKTLPTLPRDFLKLRFLANENTIGSL